MNHLTLFFTKAENLLSPSNVYIKFRKQQKIPVRNRFCKISLILLLLLIVLPIAIYVLATVSGNSNDESSLEPSFADTESRPAQIPECEKRIVGFFSEFETTEISKQQIAKLTHAVLSSVRMTSEGQLEISGAAKERFEDFKKKAEHSKVMFSIGGYENSEHFPSVVADPAKRRIFIQSIVSFLIDHKLHGVNIFWKWPALSQRTIYTTFLQELNLKLKARQYILSVVVPPGGVDNFEMGFDLGEIIDHVDFLNVYSMDYAGPWPNQWGTPTGPSVPLYGGYGLRKNFNVHYTMNYYVRKTEQPNKLNMVIPFYVRLWKNVKGSVSEGTDVFRNAELVGGKAEGTPYMSRWTAEHENISLKPTDWDDETKTAYIFDKQAKTFLTLETDRSIEEKKKYACSLGLGGVWIWTVDMDDRYGSLLNAICFDEFCPDNCNNNKVYDE